MPFTFLSTCLGGSMKSSLSLVMHAEAPLSSIKACASESKVPCDDERQVSQVVVIPVKGGGGGGGGVSNEFSFLAPVAIAGVSESQDSIVSSDLNVADPGHHHSGASRNGALKRTGRAAHRFSLRSRDIR